MKSSRHVDIEAGPVIRTAPAASRNNGGFECCFIRWCTCVHLEFIRSTPGLFKGLETLISGMIESLLLNYGLRYHATIGAAFESSLSTASASFFTSAILLVVYIVSERSYRLIRATPFEIISNALSSFFFLSSAGYLWFATKFYLWPFYEWTGGFDVYPAMTAAYLLCGLVGLVHAADTLCCLNEYRRRWRQR